MDDDEKLVWMLAAMAKLFRGEIVADAVTVADKLLDAYRERCELSEDD